MTLTGRSLGWFSLFVISTSVPVALATVAEARAPMVWRMDVNRVAWALLWTLF